MRSKAASNAAAGYEVWARALVVLLELSKLRGVSTAGAFDGLPFDESSIRRRRSIDWDDYCVVCERLEASCGTPEAAQEMFAQSYHRVLPEFRVLLGTTVSPLSFARVALEILSPIVYPACAFSVTKTAPNEIRVDVRLRPRARPCLTFFRATVGELRALPRHLGLAQAEVRAEYADHFGIYHVRLPESSSLADRITRRVRLTLAGSASGTPVVLSLGGDPDDSSLDRPTAGFESDRLSTARATWGLTARQAQVLELLVDGSTNKEIAQRLDCAENTVELHVTGLFRKAGVASRTRLIADYYRRL